MPADAETITFGLWSMSLGGYSLHFSDIPLTELGLPEPPVFRTFPVASSARLHFFRKQRFFAEKRKTSLRVFLNWSADAYSCSIAYSCSTLV